MSRILMIALVSFIAGSFAHAEPSKVPATFHTLYAPGGFDSNDHVQIVGEGLFRNSCFRPADTRVQLDRENKIIVLGPEAYEYGGICLQVILPFERVVEVGILEPGKWKVVQNSDQALLGRVNIAVSRSANPDEFLYAPISQAFFKQKAGKSEIALTGEFPNSCMKLRRVSLEIEPKVIVVLPIAEMEDREDCQNGKFPFSKVVEVKNAKAGRYLLHVRSMNAKAINTLVDVK